MSPNRLRTRAALSLLAILPTILGAQTLTFRRGVALYTVAGEFQGEAMTPWSATVTTRDTVIGGKPFVTVTRFTTQSGPGRFEATAVVDSASGRVTALFGWNKGYQNENRYQLQFAEGKLSGTDNDEGIAPVSLALAPEAVPDFAIGSFLAGRNLTDGSTIAFPVFSYSAREARSYPFTGKVINATYRREGKVEGEPAWIITGDARYPARIVVAASDRAPLLVVLPQGSVGTQTDTWQSARGN